MENNSKIQLDSFDLDQVKDVVKGSVPGEYDKMIFNESDDITRANYLYIHYKSLSAKRILYRANFPLHAPLAPLMQDLTKSQAEKAVMDSDKIVQKLTTDFHYTPESDNTPSFNYLDFPIDVQQTTVDRDQRLYYVPNETTIETCPECSGEKYVKCQDLTCDGRHEWTCTTCDGDKKVTCTDCDGEGNNICTDCRGDGKVKCGSTVGSAIVGGLGTSLAGCGGKGYVMVSNGNFADGRPRPKKEKKCSKCRGRGEVTCKDCGGKGEIKCSDCSGKGEVTCNDCSGIGKITCEYCYSDKQRRGLIDCPTCLANAQVGKLTYVKTQINDHEKEVLINIGAEIPELDLEKVQLHINKQGKMERILTNINDDIMQSNHELVDTETLKIRQEFGLDLKDFDRVLTEDIYYEVMPCVQVSYKHMLTNTVHKISIINIFNNPEVVFHSNAEEVKKGVKNSGKVVSGFFGKLFKTKSYKSKEDKKNEIKLMIYLSKADGVIEDSEKVFLSEKISSLDEFNAKEKEMLFDLMNSSNLPELTEKDVFFYDQVKKDEVLNNMTNLASSDGSIEAREQKLIDDVKSLMEK